MAISDGLINTHIFFSAFPAWGHVRPFCILAARLVQEHENITVTLLLVPAFLKKAQAEISAEFRNVASENTRRRLRVFSSFKSNAEDPFTLMAPLIETYGTVYQDLVQSKPISCSVTGEVFDAAPPPNVVVLDFFAYSLMLATRAISGRSVPIVSWLTGHVATGIRFWGPETLGGYGDVSKKAEEEAARTGATINEVEAKLYDFKGRAKGDVVKIPGVPEMHDWEYFPQVLPFEMPLADLMKMAIAGLKAADATFVTSSYIFEGESINAVKSWFSDWNQEVYIIGPLLPVGYGTVKENARGSTDTTEFLERALSEHGENSVTLISFGTVFWPAVQDYIEEVIEAFIEKNCPFILCYASPFAKISDGLIQRVQDSGIGLISKWFPQQYILNHAAIGWFMTHGGHNSVIESLGSGVPMICWPFEADQPAAAAHLSMNLKVAFELIEVRTGDNGLKPLFRSGRKPKGTRDAVGAEIREVIDSCRGEKGQELRQNAAIIKTELSKAWEADGISRGEFHRFAMKYDLRLS